MSKEELEEEDILAEELREEAELKRQVEEQSIRIILEGYEKLKKGLTNDLPNGKVYIFDGYTPIEYACVAVVPLNGSIYTLLKPIVPIEGFPPDNSFCFEIVNDGMGGYFDLIDSDVICNAVFNRYLELKNK